MIDILKFSFFLLPYICAAGLSNAETAKVFLMVGASNMHGHGYAEELSAPWDQLQSDVLIWQDDLDKNVGWTDLRPGFGASDNNFGSGGNHLREGSQPVDRFGMELSLGRILADTFPNQQIAIIKHAIGGRDLESDWNPNNLGNPDSQHMWSGLLEKTSEALPALANAGYNVEVAGLFMWQGSKDARNLSGVETPNYATNLPEFVDAVRNTFNPDIQFVMTHMPLSFSIERYPGRDTIRAVQSSLEASDPKVALVDTVNLPFDNLHLTSPGVLAMGERFASAYLTEVLTDLNGDFSNDNLVNGEDFLYWQRNPNLADLTVWQANYGADLSLVNPALVPEPSGVLLAICGIGALASHRFRA